MLGFGTLCPIAHLYLVKLSLDEDHRFSQDLSLLIFHKICCAPLRGANRKEKNLIQTKNYVCSFWSIGGF